MVDVFVPFAPNEPLTRLSGVLSSGERREFAHVLLADVLSSLEATSGVESVSVLSTATLEDDPGVPVRVDDRALTPAVNAVLDRAVSDDADRTAETGLDDAADVDASDADRAGGPAVDDAADVDADSSRERSVPGGVGVVMADLALSTPEALAELVDASGDVVLVPGRGVGTNAFVARHPDFRVDYHGTSFLDHHDLARDAGATVTVVDSYRLSTDVDEASDLAEVLAHGRGDAPAWLREHGFELERADGRVRARRTDH